MKIKWYGHSCFLITDSNGISVLTDPVDPQSGYELSDIHTDIITVSHKHHDHNYLQAANSDAKVIDKAGEYVEKGVKIRGISTWHDDVGGKKRGANIMFLFETEGMRLLHAGDLGEIPDSATIEAVGKVDVLLVPIGGVYTIDAAQARELANILKPKAVIPMHYKTQKLSFELDEIDPFIRNAKGCRIHRLNQDEVMLSSDTLGEDRILVLSV